MSSVLVKDENKAKQISTIYYPVIYQEFVSIFDCIVPMQLKMNRKSILQVYPELMPTLYYGVREDEEYYYNYYMVYHAFDYSNVSISFINKLDSHKHDTEAILVRIKKNGCVCDLCTVSHYHFYFAANCTNAVTIESGSHAIKPYDLMKPRGSYLKYKEMKLVNLNAFDNAEWEELKEDLKPASVPQEQYDTSWNGNSHIRLHTKRGDIWNRPEVVFHVAKQTKRM